MLIDRSFALNTCKFLGSEDTSNHLSRKKLTSLTEKDHGTEKYPPYWKNRRWQKQCGQYNSQKKVGRYTKHENEVVEELLKLTKEEQVQKHSVILFTFGGELEEQTLEEFIKSQSKLQEFVNKCEGRCHVIDNKYWNDCHSGEKRNRVQVNNLLDTIDKMVQKNGCFASEPLQQLEEVMEKISYLPPEVQQTAKKMVHNTILKQVVGAITGSVIGAFLGVTVCGVIVFKIPLNGLLKYIAAIDKEAAAVVETGAVTAVVETGVVAEASGAAAGAGVSTGTGIAVGVIGTAALVGAVAGGITGWKAAEDADSVYDAMKKSAQVNYENGKAVVETAQEFLSLVVNNKTDH
ncbi:uncharacterized protein LOC130430340 isoform X2 [Triplophysa dalaica]|uniref:uncharacterized protein LOC130430340 isoform X2 n=1 Tax=Triplophysa dalaica TaxID=1582913 RepID=UPI0024E01F3A|nr:uncharacterized protein LOC130430340 isoform X2 [Triplophysa dalaica]